MTQLNWLTTEEIGAIFAEEMTTQGGKVSDVFDDGSRLFLRAVLAEEREVRARDRLQGGVALRATPEEIWVHPYVFRQVCSNGAIRAHATQSLHLDRGEFSSGTPNEVEHALREAVRECSCEEAFARGVDEMRGSMDAKIDLALTMMPMLARMSKPAAQEFLNAILHRFYEGRDQSRFGLMNAVTSVARDARDPEVRWQLEAIGGGIPVMLDQQGQPPRRARAHASVKTDALLKA
jgi:hypothetical protein